MIVLKWICFLIVCSDTVAYIMQKSNISDIGIIGVFIGILARVYVLYNTITYWLLA